MSIEGLTGKENVVYAHSEILFSLKKKKKEILPFATWMDVEDITLSEISQTQKDQYCMVSLVRGI